KKEGGRFRFCTRITPALPLAKLSARRLALHFLGINRHRVCQAERHWRFRTKLDVFVSCHPRNGCACRSANRSANQRTLAAGSCATDQRSTAGAAANPRPVALLVVAANPR